MAIDLKQSLKLTQQLVMTPQLQQAIKLLQLSRLELSELINQQMTENPVLEEDRSEETVPAETVENAVREVDTESAAESSGEQSYDDLNWEEFLDSFVRSDHGFRYGEEVEKPSAETKVAKGVSLCEHLLWQLRLSDFNKEEEEIAEYIIGNLDEDGYLKMPLEYIAQEFGKSPEQIEKILQKVQNFDPAGVASRDLKECLLIQLKQWQVQNPLAQKIVANHMNELEKKDYRAIARREKVPIEKVKQAVKVICDLEPKPGRPFAEEKIQYITPDVYVYRTGENYNIILNEDGLPRLCISPYYQKLLKSGAPAATKEYIRGKLQGAMWLIRSIHQRQRTIYRVMESIVKFQKDFFDKGVPYLKPLVLRDVARDISMHESTVSRVTTNKYVHTPHGIFPMKFFFNSKINRTEGEALASESVKERIRQVVSQETQDHPCSDREIVRILRQEYGIDIARRTVTKYRENMGILSSSKRKKCS
jgi:RNA polymerase sigma-54 factor